MRLSEVYESVQGEGPRVGCPTIFVRFAGCNLRCPGWACDSQHAIDPKLYRNEWEVIDPPTLYERIRSMPHYESISNICWTGGEPFLQNLDALNDLYWSLSEDGKLIECFSNGTLKYPKWATRGSQGFRPVHFIMDWKLPGTGEDLGSYWYPKSGTTADVVMANVLELLDAEGGSAFKFTIKDRKDFEEALALANIYLPSVDPPEVFAAPVWGKMDPAELVQWLLDAKVPWRLNMQVHNFVWPRDKRGT